MDCIAISTLARPAALLAFGVLLATGAPAAAQSEPGPYARIAVLRPHDGDTVDFEAGYIRHLEWHRQAGDAWRWYGWTITFGERQRWFVYASFGHAAASLDRPVAAAEDERDNIVNVTPHAEFAGNGLYRYLPALSTGAAVPSTAPRLELTTVDVAPGRAGDFEAALGARGRTGEGETLWYRLVAGGPSTRYVCLRPRASLAELLQGERATTLPAAAAALASRVLVEVLTLRPTMSYALPAPRP
jgi:hypothetical protein